MPQKIAALFGRGIGPKVYLGQLVRPKLRITGLTGVVRVMIEFEDKSSSEVVFKTTGRHLMPPGCVFASCAYDGDSKSLFCEFLS